MNSRYSYSQFHNYFLTLLFKQKFIRQYRRFCPRHQGNALIYYKTDSLIPGYLFNYTHTNSWEIFCITKCLNQLGFWVDIIDRSIDDNYLPDDVYDIFFSNGATDSARHYTRYAKKLKKAVKIYQAVNPNPIIRNIRIKQRFSDYTKRTEQTLPLTSLTSVNINREMSNTDYIFSVGNETTNKTFRPFNKPIYKLFLSTSPKIPFDINAILDKQKNSYLFFAGAGNIFKGLDLILEAFSKLSNLNLYVCTNLEPQFLRQYQSLLHESPNIHLEGFVHVNSRRFRHLTNICGYVTMLGCAEGTATSVLTCLRRGLIPVITPETGLDVQKFGYYIKDLNIPNLIKRYQRLSNISDSEFTRRIIGSYHESSKYTQQTFAASFTNAMLNVMQRENLL